MGGFYSKKDIKNTKNTFLPLPVCMCVFVCLCGGGIIFSSLEGGFPFPECLAKKSQNFKWEWVYRRVGLTLGYLLY